MNNRTDAVINEIEKVIILVVIVAMVATMVIPYLV